jgi:hypothetical protein
MLCYYAVNLIQSGCVLTGSHCTHRLLWLTVAWPATRLPRDRLQDSHRVGRLRVGYGVCTLVGIGHLLATPPPYAVLVHDAGFVLAHTAQTLIIRYVIFPLL